ncbi:28 kDa heat- and acid-stable phosphoprotein-like isoform X4 [Durio zibethinus]|uniref:28 kDa heat- and acid-stable phosphoprotein-like isoform X4 n=1 Tax=Durio zibethinus TaxID=66656 RepID=A0A6P5X8S8_DURZI|nr:28 kDa heat- and acid-stable phosphoprotein-like isoform X4 [Durio zibethinus]
MGRGKFKAKPTGQRHFSTPEEMLAEAEYREEEESEECGQESGEESDGETEQKHKVTQGIIEINNPNRVKPKNLKARDADTGKTNELSRREREELEKQRAHERYIRLQEQGKTEQARKDLERLSLTRQQREEAARKREEEKAAREQKKVEARK